MHLYLSLSHITLSGFRFAAALSTHPVPETNLFFEPWWWLASSVTPLTGKQTPTLKRKVQPQSGFSASQISCRSYTFSNLDSQLKGITRKGQWWIGFLSILKLVKSYSGTTTSQRLLGIETATFFSEECFYFGLCVSVCVDGTIAVAYTFPA